MPIGPPKLKDEHRAFVVRELACYLSPVDIVVLVKEQFGITVTAPAIEYYDASKIKCRASKKWRVLFEECRRKFLDHMEDRVPFANKAVRVQELDQAARRAKTRKNDVLMAAHLEQIAKEVGNVHTNKREHSGPSGKPLQFEDVNTLTPDQVRDELRTHMADPNVKAFVLGLMGTDLPATQPGLTKEQSK